MKSFNISENLTEYQSAFNTLTEDSIIKETTVSKIKDLRAMYVKKKSTIVNNGRLDLILHTYKTLDRSSMPPYYHVLQENSNVAFIFKKRECLHPCYMHIYHKC